MKKRDRMDLSLEYYPFAFYDPSLHLIHNQYAKETEKDIFHTVIAKILEYKTLAGHKTQSNTKMQTIRYTPVLQKGFDLNNGKG